MKINMVTQSAALLEDHINIVRETWKITTNIRYLILPFPIKMFPILQDPSVLMFIYNDSPKQIKPTIQGISTLELLYFKYKNVEVRPTLPFWD